MKFNIFKKEPINRWVLTIKTYPDGFQGYVVHNAAVPNSVIDYGKDLRGAFDFAVEANAALDRVKELI